MNNGCRVKVAHGWYNRTNWYRRRAHQLQVEPLCRLCAKEGRLTPATVVDHVVPHKGETTTYFAWDNCRVCAALATTARRRSSKRVASIQRLVSMAGHSIPVTQSTDTTSAE